MVSSLEEIEGAALELPRSGLGLIFQGRHLFRLRLLLLGLQAHDALVDVDDLAGKSSSFFRAALVALIIAWMSSTESRGDDWFHSDFKAVCFNYVWPMWQEMIDVANLDQ